MNIVYEFDVEESIVLRSKTENSKYFTCCNEETVYSFSFLLTNLRHKGTWKKKSYSTVTWHGICFIEVPYETEDTALYIIVYF